MKAIVVSRGGSPEVLELIEQEPPQPGPQEVLIESCAVGVNFADIWARLAPDPVPMVPGIEVAGVILEVGADVEGLAAGDRVVAAPWFARGAYAELVTAPATHTWPIPDALDFDTAAAVPLNYLTAYVGLVRFAGLRPAEQVLIHAAAGGVGLAGVQLAAQRGARVRSRLAGEARVPQRHPGVDHVVDYSRPGWDDEVRRRSGGGVDIVLDGVGEDGYLKSLRTLRYGGRLAASGYSAGILDRSTPPDQASAELEAPWSRSSSCSRTAGRS